eukprot:5720563-Amphidinium_carterae.2
MQGACQDIHWSNRAPEGFADFVDQCATSDDAGINLKPPFATQSVGPPPGLRLQHEIDERGPQTPERPQYSSSSPEGSGSDGSGKGAGSTPNRVIGSPNPLSGRSDLDPLQGRVGNRTSGGGHGGGGPATRMTTTTMAMVEYRLNRDKLKLPKLEIVDNFHTISPATMQQLLLNWIRDTTKKIGTWHIDAPEWFERTVKQAKTMHLRFVASTPKEQAALKKKYVLGRASPIPRPEHALESLARCEVLDVLPPWLKRQINTAGVHTTKDIV